MIKNDKLKNDINLGMLIGQVHRLSTKKFVQNSHDSGLDISMDQWIVSVSYTHLTLPTTPYV